MTHLPLHLFNRHTDYVKDHMGHTLEKVKDYTLIRGMKREKDVTIVAAYHFLVKKIF